MTCRVEPNPARSVGIRSMLISAISDTRFWSMLMRASTRRCRSFAAWYSAFSRRSPSSRARLISLGSSSLSSWFSVASSSSNFLISRSFIGSAEWYHSAMLSDVVPTRAPRRVTSRHNPNIARYRAVARGDALDLLLLDGPHLVADALAAGVALESVAVLSSALDRPEISALISKAEALGADVVTATPEVMAVVSPVRSSSAIVALGRRPARDARRLYTGAAPLVLIAADLQD